MKLREFTEEGNQKFILLYQKIKASVQQKKSIEKGYTSNFQKQMEDLVQDNNLSKELSVFSIVIASVGSFICASSGALSIANSS